MTQEKAGRKTRVGILANLRVFILAGQEKVEEDVQKLNKQTGIIVEQCRTFLFLSFLFFLSFFSFLFFFLSFFSSFFSFFFSYQPPTVGQEGVHDAGAPGAGRRGRRLLPRPRHVRRGRLQPARQLLQHLLHLQRPESGGICWGGGGGGGREREQKVRNDLVVSNHRGKKTGGGGEDN